MFYIKHNGEEIEIDQDSIMTCCPACGREMNVDHERMFSGEFDWYGTSFFCNKDCLNLWKLATLHEVIDEMADDVRPALHLIVNDDQATTN